MGRRKVFKIAGVLLLFRPLLSIEAQPARESANQNPKLESAVITANRIVNRFHQTLDFKEILNEEFVTDPALRARALSVDEEDKWKQFDLATRERLYVSLMTFLHLWGEYTLVQKDHDVPPEVDKRPELKILSNSDAPKSMAELNQRISELETLCRVYRKYLPADAFSGAQYRQSIRDGAAFAKEHAHNVPRVEDGNSKFGIPTGVPVYVVRPEAFDYYFVEEKGRMRLFHVNIFPNFPLF